MANIMVTKRCNLSCPYCFANDYVHSDANNDSDIDLDTFHEIMNFIMYDKTQKTLGLIGGEPTLHKLFDDILTVLDGVNKLEKITIYTNGIELIKYIGHLKNEKYYLLINCNDLTDKPELKKAFTESIDTAYNQIKERITLGVNFYKIGFDYSYIIDLLKIYHFDKLRVSVSVPNEKYSYEPYEYFSLIKGNIINFFHELKKINVIPFFDCNIFPACLINADDIKDFSEWGAENPFSIIKNRQTGCLPVVDILPDKTAIRCFGLSEYTRQKIDNYLNITDLTNFYLRTIDAFAINCYYDNRCANCYKYKTVKCSGGCLIYKIDKITTMNRDSY